MNTSLTYSILPHCTHQVHNFQHSHHPGLFLLQKKNSCKHVSFCKSLLSGRTATAWNAFNTLEMTGKIIQKKNLKEKRNSLNIEWRWRWKNLLPLFSVPPLTAFPIFAPFIYLNMKSRRMTTVWMEHKRPHQGLLRRTTGSGSSPAVIFQHLLALVGQQSLAKFWCLTLRGTHRGSTAQPFKHTPFP